MSSVQERPVVQPLELTAGEMRFYNEEGYLYLPGLLSAEVAATLREEVLFIMEQSGNTLDLLRQATESRHKLIQNGQYLAGSTLDSFINSEALRSIASQLMGGPGTLYMPFTAVKSGGGGGRFHFHQDNQYTRFDGPGINLWTALSPMTPENGCLQIVPRSHLQGTFDPVAGDDGDGHRKVAQEPERFLPLRMNPGDCVAFSRLTIHGSGPNHTSEPRVAYAVQFHRDDVSTQWDGESHLLTQKPRWQTGPVQEITTPREKSRDGH